MSSEVLTSQVALTDRDRGDSTTVGDDIAISVRNVLRPPAGPLEAGFSVGPEKAVPRVLPWAMRYWR